MRMRLRSGAAAVVTASLLLAAVPATAATRPARPPAPSPSPSPSPDPTAKCAIPAGMEDDPQEQALHKQCLAQVQQVEDEKAKLQGALAMAQGSSQSLQDMIAQTKQAIQDNKKHQADVQAKIHTLELQEAATAADLTVTRQQLALHRAQYADFLRRSYKNSPEMWVALFDSGGIADFVSRASTVVRLQLYGRDLLTLIHNDEQRLESEQEQEQTDHAAAVKQQQELVSAQEQLVNDEVRLAVILTQLQGSIKDAQTELTAADTQTADLVQKVVEAEIAREDQLIQAANDATWQAAQAWMASNNAVYPPSANHSKKFELMWPVSHGQITQPFGPSNYDFEPAYNGFAHFHTGIDIANSEGTTVRAADDGIVAVASDTMLGSHEIGYGKHVIILSRVGNQTWMTLYGHLEGWVVKPGDTVTQGQVIGLMGSTGNSTGPHLHFELRVEDTPQDPAPYLPPNGPNDFNG